MRRGPGRAPRLGVAEQVELAAAVAGLDVRQAVVLVRRRAQRLGEHGDPLRAQGQLPATGAEDHAVDPDQVAEVQLEQAVHRLLPQHVAAGLQLQAPRAVVEVQEGHLPLPAPGVQAAGDAVPRVRLGPRLEVRVGRADVRDRRDPGEVVRERVDPRRAQRVELGAARREQGVAHPGRLARRRRRRPTARR
jgi:hypothetical protein